MIKTFILGTAHIHYLDRTGSTILEADAVEALVEVDGVLPGHHLYQTNNLNISTTKSYKNYFLKLKVASCIY
jgi:hypothetical protein